MRPSIHPWVGFLSSMLIGYYVLLAKPSWRIDENWDGTAVNAYASGLYHIYSKKRWKERLVPPGRRQLDRQRSNFLALIPYFAYIVLMA